MNKLFIILFFVFAFSIGCSIPHEKPNEPNESVFLHPEPEDEFQQELARRFELCKSGEQFFDVCFWEGEVNFTIYDIKQGNIAEHNLSSENYCSFKNENSSCKCPDGHTKIFQGDYYPRCIPTPCVYLLDYRTIKGTNIISLSAGECGAEAYGIAANCSYFQDPLEKDVCVFASAMITNNRTKCASISNEHLKNECTN